MSSAAAPSKGLLGNGALRISDCRFKIDVRPDRASHEIAKSAIRNLKS